MYLRPHKAFDIKWISDIFRARIYRGHYPEFLKISGKRKYKLENIKDLIEITEVLVKKGILFAGKTE